MINCVNLCEINLNKYLNNKYIYEWLYNCVVDNDRIYIGSYFCSRFFLGNNYEKVLELALMENKNVTLVIPVFTENSLEVAKKTICEIISKSKNVIDEITVNDIGMLKFIKDNMNVKINLGRLFFKDPRDCRVPDYGNAIRMVNRSSTIRDIIDVSLLNMIEIDEISSEIKIDEINSLNVAIHTPFCFMTTGNICKFAAINKSIDNKFRPNCKCEKECSFIYEHYSEIYNGFSLDIYRIGRTVYYYKKNRSKVIGCVRNIYFPFIDIIEVLERV